MCIRDSQNIVLARASPRTFFVGHTATSPKNAVSAARVCPPCWSEPPPPTITAGSGTRQSGCARWESNRTLARFSIVHMTAAIVGMDAKVGQQSVNAVPEKALVAFCFDDQLVGKRELWKLAARTEPPPGRRELPVQPSSSQDTAACASVLSGRGRSCSAKGAYHLFTLP